MQGKELVPHCVCALLSLPLTTITHCCGPKGRGGIPAGSKYMYKPSLHTLRKCCKASNFHRFLGGLPLKNGIYWKDYRPLTCTETLI